MGAIAWIFVGIGLALFGMTDVIPHGWILSLVGGGIIGTNIARAQLGM